MSGRDSNRLLEEGPRSRFFKTSLGGFSDIIFTFLFNCCASCV